MINLARLLIGLVYLFNMECAVSFIIAPGLYTGGFSLPGEVGSFIIRAIGILFIMWNIPYAFALWHPVRHKISLIQALLMQAVGLLGECWLLWGLAEPQWIVKQSITRFIAFDAVGLAALLLAFWCVFKIKQNDVR